MRGDHVLDKIVCWLWPALDFGRRGIRGCVAGPAGGLFYQVYPQGKLGDRHTNDRYEGSLGKDCICRFRLSFVAVSVGSRRFVGPAGGQ